MRTQFPSGLASLVEAIREINKHGVAAIIAASDTHERMTKKSRADGSPVPAWAQGLRALTYSTVNLNHDYTKAINNHLEKTGFNPNFVADESTVSKPIEGWPNTILRESPKNPDQLYVRVFIEMSKAIVKPEVFYINGLGQNVTDQVTKEFKENFFPKQYGSQKQAEHGVSKEVQVREYKAENILYLQKGKVVYNKLSQDVMNLFNLELVD